MGREKGKAEHSKVKKCITNGYSEASWVKHQGPPRSPRLLMRTEFKGYPLSCCNLHRGTYPGHSEWTLPFFLPLKNKLPQKKMICFTFISLMILFLWVTSMSYSKRSIIVLHWKQKRTNKQTKNLPKTMAWDFSMKFWEK